LWKSLTVRSWVVVQFELHNYPKLLAID
jgi:hypothetical protein